jgi:alkylhydroperoxidase family enzyme
MHTQDARAEGESEQRLYALDAWRETPFFNERERAALEWTEAVTLVADTHVPDDVYERVKQHFTGQELIDLTLAITNINAWNRLNVAFRTLAGNYRPGMYKSSSPKA